MTTTYTLNIDSNTARLFGTTETLEDAEAIVATLPKSLGLRAAKFYEANQTKGCIVGHAVLRANGTNGGANEAGLSRMQRWVKVLNPTIEDER